MLLAPKWEVSENGDIAISIIAEDVDEDVDEDEVLTYSDAVTLDNREIELKHEVSIAQRGCACHKHHAGHKWHITTMLPQHLGSLFCYCSVTCCIIYVMLEDFSHGRHHVLGKADVCAPAGTDLICLVFASLCSATSTTFPGDTLMMWLDLACLWFLGAVVCLCRSFCVQKLQIG